MWRDSLKKHSSGGAGNAKIIFIVRQFLPLSENTIFVLSPEIPV